MREDKDRLQDILEAIGLLEKYLSNNKPLYTLTELEFMGVIKCIEIIGEACRGLSDGFKQKYVEIPWRQIANMRNILAHQYFEVDVEKVEQVIKEEIPKLKVQIEEILKKEE